MNEKLVLPRFELPGEGTHGAIRAVWVTGVLVVVATLVLGLAMWRHQALEVANAEQAAAKIAAARRAALVPAPAPALATQAAAPAAGSMKGSVTGAAAGSTVLSAMVPSASSDSREAPATPRVRRRGGKARMSASARASFEGKPSRRSSSNDDVIDRLLRQ